MQQRAEVLTNIAPDRRRIVDIISPDVEVDEPDEGRERHPEDVQDTSYIPSFADLSVTPLGQPRNGRTFQVPIQGDDHQHEGDEGERCQQRLLNGPGEHGVSERAGGWFV